MGLLLVRSYQLLMEFLVVEGSAGFGLLFFMFQISKFLTLLKG